MAKILIIKLGHSETLDPEIGVVPSLGDVLRTTVILYPFRDDHVTWLVDGDARPLLEGNPLIDRILTYNLSSVLQLQRERYDTVINLEKVPGLCALADSVSAWRRYGFRFDEATGIAQPYDGCETVFSMCKDPDLKKAYPATWQESLLQVIGAKWEGQEYILGYRPKTEEVWDVGINWAVGSKWPNKAWPKPRWDELLALLEGRFTYSLQQGMTNLYEYMDWIHSCRLLVTNDSLGLHIALALQKRVVVLYGPTNPNETFFYGRAEVLYPTVERTCVPCLAGHCTHETPCMDSIPATEVFARIERLLTTQVAPRSGSDRDAD